MIRTKKNTTDSNVTLPKKEIGTTCAVAKGEADGDKRGEVEHHDGQSPPAGREKEGGSMEEGQAADKAVSCPPPSKKKKNYPNQRGKKDALTPSDAIALTRTKRKKKQARRYREWLRKSLRRVNLY